MEMGEIRYAKANYFFFICFLVLFIYLFLNAFADAKRQLYNFFRRYIAIYRISPLQSDY